MGFRVWGLGLNGDQRLGFRISGLGFGVWGSGVYQQRFGAVRQERAPAVRARHWSQFVFYCYLKLTEVPLLLCDVPTLDVCLGEQQRELGFKIPRSLPKISLGGRFAKHGRRRDACAG